MSTNQKVWFVTGANKGIGAAIVKEALAQGYNVVAAARKTDEAERNLGAHPNLLIVPLDICNDAQVNQAVEATMTKFGQGRFIDATASYTVSKKIGVQLLSF